MAKVLNLTIGTTGGGGNSPTYPYNTNNFTAIVGNAQVKLSWSDPVDPSWTGTKVLRKTGGFPTNESDGVLVIDSTTKDTYSSEAYIDTTVQNGTLYYYQAFPYAGEAYCNNELNRATAQPIAVVELGVEIDLSSKDTSAPAIATRLLDALNLTATPGTISTPQQSDFDLLPVYSGIRLCNLSALGVVNAYEGDTGFTLDGTNGDVMVEVPAYWHKRTFTPNVSIAECMSTSPLPGYTKHPAFDRPGIYADMDKIYVSPFNLSGDASMLNSVANATAFNGTVADARTAITNKGSNWYLYDYTANCALITLFLIEYARLDTAELLPYTSANPGVAIQTLPGHTGFDIQSSSSQTLSKYRNIEGFMGMSNTLVEGLRGSYSTSNYYMYNFVIQDPTQFGKINGDSMWSRSLTTSVLQPRGCRDLPWQFFPVTGSATAGTWAGQIPARYSSNVSAGSSVMRFRSPAGLFNMTSISADNAFQKYYGMYLPPKP